MKFINATRELAIGRTYKKMVKDLTAIEKFMGTNINVDGKISIHYQGIAEDIFDAALKQLTTYNRYKHNILIHDKLSVFLLLD